MYTHSSYSCIQCSIDSPQVFGEVEEFSSAIQKVISDVRFDSDVIVSVFETNIRVLG